MALVHQNLVQTTYSMHVPGGVGAGYRILGDSRGLLVHFEGVAVGCPDTQLERQPVCETSAFTRPPRSAHNKPPVPELQCKTPHFAVLTLVCHVISNQKSYPNPKHSVPEL